MTRSPLEASASLHNWLLHIEKPRSCARMYCMAVGVQHLRAHSLIGSPGEAARPTALCASGRRLDLWYAYSSAARAVGQHKSRRSTYYATADLAQLHAYLVAQVLHDLAHHLPPSHPTRWAPPG